MNFLRTVIALCSGFANYRAYRDLALTTSLKYLLKLITLLALVLMICAVPPALNGIDEFARRFDQHRPDFSIHDGKVTTRAPQPYSWGNNDVRFILDTTSAVAAPDSNATFGVLFTGDSFLYWLTLTNAPAPLTTHLQSLRGFPDGNVTGEYFRHLVRSLLWLAMPFGWLLLVLFAMLSCLLQAYLFAAIASFMERSMTAPLQLSQLLNVAIHASTPAAIVVTAYTAMRLPNLNLWLVYLIVYGIFLVGASAACRDHEQKREPPVDNLL